MIDQVSGRDIAMMGIRAQRARMNLIANNIANAETTRTREGGAFRRQLAVFRGEHFRSGVNPRKLGVRVKSIVSDPSPLRRVFEPGHADADADGYVEYPNVDLSVEMVNLVSATRAYEANIAVIVNHRRMGQKALEIIQA